MQAEVIERKVVILFERCKYGGEDVDLAAGIRRQDCLDRTVVSLFFVLRVSRFSENSLRILVFQDVYISSFIFFLYDTGIVFYSRNLYCT